MPRAASTASRTASSLRDVGMRCSCRHRHRDARARNIDATGGVDPAEVAPARRGPAQPARRSRRVRRTRCASPRRRRPRTRASIGWPDCTRVAPQPARPAAVPGRHRRDAGDRCLAAGGQYAMRHARGLSRCSAIRPCAAARACRTCRVRGRRPRDARASCSSLASRATAASSVFAASAAGTTTTPSSSATMTSPGVTSAPAQTTGTLTEPSVAFTVPRADTALLQTGNCISRQRPHVAHAGIDHQRARAAGLEARGEQVAEVAVAARRRDAGHDDVARRDLFGRDVQHPVVARLQQHGHRGTRRVGSGVHGAHVGLHQARASQGLVDGGGAQRCPGARRRRRPRARCGDRPHQARTCQRPFVLSAASRRG